MIGKIIEDFLLQFIGHGPSSERSMMWSLEQIIRMESTHFLCSSFAGLLAFSLTLTIYSFRKPPAGADRYIYRIGLSCALLVSVTVHIVIDGFTGLA